MGVEELLRNVANDLGQIIGIVEDLKEIKLKLNNIERDISGYREEMIELRTNVKNFQDRFNEHRATQILDFDKMGAFCRETSCGYANKIDLIQKEFTDTNSQTKKRMFEYIVEAKKEATADAVTEVKLWLYGSAFLASGSLIAIIAKEFFK